MKYLISGHKGFIGRNLVKHLIYNKIPFDVLDGEFHYNADTFVHLSAATDVRQSIKNPCKSFNLNCFKTFSMLKFARDHEFKKFIFASSASVDNPTSPYHASKVCGEAYCRIFKESYGLDTSIIRFSNVYGPCSEYKTSIIPKFIKSAIKDEPFYIYGDGMQMRDFVYIDDVISSIINVRDELTVAATGVSINIKNLVRMLSQLAGKLLGKVPTVMFKDSINGEIRDGSVESTMEATVSLEKGLRKTFRWFIKEWKVV